MTDVVKYILKHPIATGILIGTATASIIKAIRATEKTQ